MEITEREVGQFIYTFRHLNYFDFSAYSRKSLGRRIGKVLLDFQLPDIQALFDLVRQKPLLVSRVIEMITVNTTELFRDPPMWAYLYRHVFPMLKEREKIQLWHIGCSSGEEVYSARGLLQTTPLFERSFSLGTDLNSNILEKAKEAAWSYRFHEKYIRNMEEVNALLHKEGSHPVSPIKDLYEINKLQDRIYAPPLLKKQTRFEVFDVTRPDRQVLKTANLIFCRNLLIYFTDEYQNRILQYLHEHLEEGGYLILGKHEVMGESLKSLFTPLEQQVYKKKKR